MPKYHGSTQDVRTPFMRASEMTHTTDQINSWWDTLASGVNGDIRVSRDLNRESHILFSLNDDGTLSPAVKRGEDVSNTDVRRRLLDQSRAGRLFIRGLDDTLPRQILTDTQYQTALTAPTNTLPAVEGNLPPKPRRPFFLKFIFPALFREEIDAYKVQKGRYDQAVQRREMIQNFHDNVKKGMKESITREANDPDIAERKSAQAKAISDAWEQKKARQAEATQAAEKEWMNNPSEKTLGIFENHLRDMFVTDFSRVAQRMVSNGGGTLGEYCTALAQMLERQFALPLLDQADDFTRTADKDAFLLRHQNDYIKMMKNIKSLVHTHVDMERAQEFFQTENPTAAQKDGMQAEIRHLAANGIKEYRALASKPEALIAAPKPELDLQLQQQVQPQPAPAPVPGV